MNIIVRNLNKSFGEKIIFEDFNIELQENKVNCILGKSGCGKSTFLNILSRLVEKDGGDITGLEENRISYVFQEDRLIEWLTVEENITMVLRKQYKDEDLKAISRKYLAMVGLEGEEKNYPKRLSGGMKQRVNIARAFAYPSKVIFMDEPFKSLDVKNKLLIFDNFKRILEEDNRTVVFVTHDVDEAIYLGDNIFIFADNPTKVVATFKEDKNRDDIIKFI